MLDIPIARAVRVAAMNDDSSLAAAARRDPAAFSKLYQRYVTRVYRYIYSHVGNEQDAEDITAQVFGSAWEGLSRYREQGQFASWLFRIARNKTNDFYRSRREHLSIDELADKLWEEMDPLETVERREVLHRLAVLVDDLRGDEQELVRLRFAAGLSHAEIATLMGRSEGAIKMALHRLLRRLQAEWEKGNE
jgi:RNA polymerase sigma-70 factor, ECF subfamily